MLLCPKVGELMLLLKCVGAIITNRDLPKNKKLLDYQAT